jgi:hypothetical protein
MTQNELLEQAKNYIDYNLNDEKKLELVIDILDDLSVEAFKNDCCKKGNTLTTTILILKEIKEKNEEAIPLF